MADKKPNFELELKRLEIDTKQLGLNLEKVDLRKMELDEEKRRLDIGKESTLESIKENKKRISILKEKL